MLMEASLPPFDNSNENRTNRPGSTRLFVVMGVAGCGKSSVGEALAARMGGTFLDGDDLHPATNIDKMSRGEPLDDEDRAPWLARIAEAMAGSSGVVFAGCSALKRRYRDILRQGAGEPMCFVHLAGSRELIASRMAARSGHFMPASLLDSQFSALESPSPDEDHITVDVSGGRDEVVAAILDDLDSRQKAN
jgi:gluconokinase